MRTNQLVRALFLIVMGSLGTSSAIAQSTIAPIVAYHPQRNDGSSFADKIKKTDLVNAADILAAVTKGATFEGATVESRNAFSVPLANVKPTTGTAIEVASPEVKATSSAANSVSLLEEHKLNVKVQYDARPVGGILTVRVSITPTFRGIGVSTRPAASRSLALAVDEFTQEAVNKLVEELTEEISAEFNAITEPSTAATDALIH